MEVGELEVWWIPQVPMKAFTVAVKNLREARLLLNTLAEYDLFQLKHKVKPDYSNAGGLRVWSSDDGDGTPGWTDWHDEFGNDFDDVPDEDLETVKWEEVA